jgi:diphosphate-dependent phosphofructokinase
MEYPEALMQARLRYQPRLPRLLASPQALVVQQGAPTGALGHVDELQALFPKTFGQPEVMFRPTQRTRPATPIKVGVVLSGGQAPGGHNVIAGLLDALKKLDRASSLIGFLGGPSGIVEGRYRELTEPVVNQYRNLGGFDMIGSGRTKIETEEQLHASRHTCARLGLHGLVIIGGDDSNTNAALLAEFFKTQNCPTSVIGVPKTIDGDLKNDKIEISFGHDTACKVYSELIGNLMRDALSAGKYYHFIKLMGRSASHIALECALRTHPNAVLIGEEVAASRQTLEQITATICDLVEARARVGKQFGIVLIPEGLIEFIPEVGVLIGELNSLLGHSDHSQALDKLGSVAERVAYVQSRLGADSSAVLNRLPEAIQGQLLFDRDPHGNVQVSLIETEKLLIATVSRELKRRNFKGKFGAIHHFFGYEGRSAMPSLFDCHYCYALGYTAALLVHSGLTGYMSTVHQLGCPPEEWTLGGTPLTMMMDLEMRKGKTKPVIRKALVDLKGPAFAVLASNRQAWAVEDQYGYPGPIQFFGPGEITDQLPIALALESPCKIKSP